MILILFYDVWLFYFSLIIIAFGKNKQDDKIRVI